MAVSFANRILKNNRGQSVVEYILLLSVLVSLGYAVLNNKKFKDLLKGDVGMFANMRNGMRYSYRYGLEYTKTTDVESKSSFNYTSRDHDTYFGGTTSRFFSPASKYP